jgi:hypothetical protein
MRDRAERSGAEAPAWARVAWRQGYAVSIDEPGSQDRVLAMSANGYQGHRWTSSA